MALNFARHIFQHMFCVFRSLGHGFLRDNDQYIMDRDADFENVPHENSPSVIKDVP